MWGAEEVDGLDAARAEALKLKPVVHQTGPASGERIEHPLPGVLAQPGSCRRYLRRTAEQLLHQSVHWEAIEQNTHATSKSDERLR